MFFASVIAPRALSMLVLAIFLPRFVTVAKERCAAFEGLFKPELWGKDTRSIPDMVYDAVMACSIDSRKDMCRFVPGSFLRCIFVYFTMYSFLLDSEISI